MGKNIKILVCAHKDSRLPQHEYFCPIQVGASLTSARFFPVLDNTGDNISDRNPHFCELTAHYWAWKNLKCDIIGIIRKTKCFDFWERNVLFPKTKRSFFRTPTPLPCPFPLNFSLLIITKKFGNLAKNRYICIV